MNRSYITTSSIAVPSYPELAATGAVSSHYSSGSKNNYSQCDWNAINTTSELIASYSRGSYRRKILYNRYASNQSCFSKQHRLLKTSSVMNKSLEFIQGESQEKD